MGQRDKPPARPMPKEDSGEELWLTLKCRQAKTHIQDEQQQQQQQTKKKPDFREKDQKAR